MNVNLRRLAVAFGLPLTCALFSFNCYGATSYYVSTIGSDSNNGTSTNTPFKTINYALTIVRYGDTLFLRGGTYRELVWGESLAGLGASSGSTNNMLTIRNYASEIPIIKGSVIATNWQSDSGSVWKKTNWTTRSQQVFANEVYLTHLGWNAGLDVYPGVNPTTNLPELNAVPDFTKGRSDMFAGSFFHDTNTWTLYVWLPNSGNPNTNTMEVSVGMPWFILHPFVKVSGLRFRHSSLMQITGGWPAVGLLENSILENSVVEWCDFAGFSMRENSQILNCTFANNGMIGFGVGTNSIVRGCTVVSNHYLPFDLRGEAGGTKIIGGNACHADNILIESNTFAWNIGPGVWFDSMTNIIPAIIRGNHIHHNLDGIMLEISTNFVIYNNLIEANSVRGIYISQASGSRIFHNTIVVPFGGEPSSVCAIAIAGGWGPRSNYYSADIVITNNIVFDESTLRGMGYTRGPRTKNVFIDYNCYFATNGNTLFSVIDYDITGTNFSANAVNYSVWKTNGFDANSIIVDPLFLDRANQKFWPWKQSPIVSRGVAIGTVTNDYEGVARPGYNGGYTIGSYEYVFEDTDGDGMENDWETLHGLNPNSSSDASQDADSDGFTNLQEYGRNTNPTAAASRYVKFYVDNAIGSDAKSGFYATLVNFLHGPKSTINNALTASLNGDTIEVKGGNYVENVDLRTKYITFTLNGNLDLR